MNKLWLLFALMLPCPAWSADPARASSSITRGTLLAPQAFRAAAAKISPSLVTIEGFGGLAAGTGTPGLQAAGEGPTTGVIISADGYILTSTFNFLRQPPIITVILPGGQRKIAKLLGRDETRKICLLKVAGVSDLPLPQVAPRKDLRVGQWAVALGIGYGNPQPALSAGIISATSRISGKAVQTDVNLSPANYGGPLVDIDGRLIGICVPLSSDSLSANAKSAAAGAEWYDSGIGFAIPLDGLEKVIVALKAGETLVPAYLGVQTRTESETAGGAIVKSVVPDSPAKKADLREGDRLVSIGGIEIIDPVHLTALIGRYLAGETAEISIRRGEEKRSIRVEFGSHPVVETAAATLIPPK